MKPSKEGIILEPSVRKDSLLTWLLWKLVPQDTSEPVQNNRLNETSALLKAGILKPQSLPESPLLTLYERLHNLTGHQESYFPPDLIVAIRADELEFCLSLLLEETAKQTSPLVNTELTEGTEYLKEIVATHFTEPIS